MLCEKSRKKFDPEPFDTRSYCTQIAFFQVIPTSTQSRTQALKEERPCQHMHAIFVLYSYYQLDLRDTCCCGRFCYCYLFPILGVNEKNKKCEQQGTN